MDEERLLVSLEARITDFEKKMARAEKRGTRTFNGLRRSSTSATRSFERDMRRQGNAVDRAMATASTRIGTFSKAFAGGIIGGAVTVGLQQLTTGLAATVKGIASIGDEAERSGLAIDRFQEWKFVAEQNRIGVDALVDGFKELNLRVDEFVVTGRGPAAEALVRLGFTADELKDKLEDPSELMLEIIDRLQDLDRAAQIRISDEVFGGTGGEQFVQLLSQGRGEIERTIAEGVRLGAVMDAEAIAKAEELDRKFSEIRQSVSALAKTAVVEFAAALTDVREGLDELFADLGNADSIVGAGAASQLRDSNADLEDSKETVDELRELYVALLNDIGITAGAIGNEVPAVLAEVSDEAAIALDDVVTLMQQLSMDLRSGEIDAETFGDEMNATLDEASALLAEVNAIDSVDLNFVIGRVAALSGQLAGAFERAVQLRSALPGNSPAGGRGDGSIEVQARRAAAAQVEANDRFIRGQTELNALTSQQLDLQREIETVQKRAADAGAQLTQDQAETLAAASLAARARRAAEGTTTGGGVSGGGGGGREGDFQRELANIRERTAALTIEAQQFLSSAQSAGEYEYALEKAEAKAALFAAAQRDGLVITPALAASIDDLASAYVNAGREADEARDKIEGIAEASRNLHEEGRETFADLVSGARSFGDVLSDLGSQLIRLGASSFFDAIFPASGGGFGGFISSLFGGFRAQGGPVSAGRAYMVGERGPELFLPTTNGTIVPNGASAGGKSEVLVRLAVPQGVTMAEAQQISGDMAVRVVTEYDSKMDGRVNEIFQRNDPRLR